MTRVATVAISTPNGPVLINESDFDKDKHTLYVELEPSELDAVKPDPKKQSANWLKARLTDKGINFDGVNKKADLLTLYEASHG